MLYHCRHLSCWFTIYFSICCLNVIYKYKQNLTLDPNTARLRSSTLEPRQIVSIGIAASEWILLIRCDVIWDITECTDGGCRQSARTWPSWWRCWGSAWPAVCPGPCRAPACPPPCRRASESARMTCICCRTPWAECDPPLQKIWD